MWGWPSNSVEVIIWKNMLFLTKRTETETMTQDPLFHLFIYFLCLFHLYIYIYIYKPETTYTCFNKRIFTEVLTYDDPLSLSFIASSRSSGPLRVSSHSCWIYVCAGRPAFAQPYVGVHRSTSLMSSFLLLQQWPACLVRLTWIVFVMGGRWPYSWCFVGCCRQDLFNIARNILA